MRVALLCMFVLAACGPKNKNQCAGNVAGTCVTGEQCSFDEARGCQVCQCAPLDNDTNDPFATDQNRNPDDRSQPPEPVH